MDIFTALLKAQADAQIAIERGHFAAAGFEPIAKLRLIQSQRDVAGKLSVSQAILHRGKIL